MQCSFMNTFEKSIVCEGVLFIEYSMPEYSVFGPYPLLCPLAPLWTLNMSASKIY